MQDSPHQNKYQDPARQDLRWLRKALLTLPWIFLVLTAIIIIMFDWTVQEIGVGRIVSTLYFGFIYPLAYAALCLRAAHELKPLENLNLRHLKWILLTLAFAVLIGDFFYLIQLLDTLVLHSEDAVFYVARYVPNLLQNILLMLLCFFAAAKSRSRNYHEPTDVIS